MLLVSLFSCVDICSVSIDADVEWISVSPMSCIDKISGFTCVYIVHIVLSTIYFACKCVSAMMILHVWHLLSWH